MRQANGSVFNTLTCSYTDSVSGLADPTGHLRQETDGLSQNHAFHHDNLCELIQETHPVYRHDQLLI